MAHVRSIQSPLREFTTECSPDMARLRAGSTVVTIRVSKQELANDQIDRSEFLDFVGVGDKHSWTLQLLIAPYAVFLLFVIPAAVVCHWHVAEEQILMSVVRSGIAIQAASRTRTNSSTAPWIRPDSSECRSPALNLKLTRTQVSSGRFSSWCQWHSSSSLKV